MIVYHGTAAAFAESILRTGIRELDGKLVCVAPRIELSLQYAYAKAEAIRALHAVPLRGAVAVANVADSKLRDAPSHYGRCRLPETGGDTPVRYRVVHGPVRV